MHVKRQTANKEWPIPRKGTKYVVVASHEKINGIPILIILREILKIVKDRREAKNILNSGEVKVNDRVIKKENFSVLPFDIVKIRNKKYELTFSEKGKVEIKNAEKEERILKVTGKKILKGKKIQLNLLYGKNIISDGKINIGDSVVLKDGKILKIINLEKGKDAMIIAGRYKGKSGKIEKIENKIATLSHKNEKINVPVDSIMVIK